MLCPRIGSRRTLATFAPVSGQTAKIAGMTLLRQAGRLVRRRTIPTLLRSNHNGTIMEPINTPSCNARMPSLTIKNIPEPLYRQLKASAQAHHRSLNSELIHCLEAALLPRKATAAELLEAARALRRQVSVRRISLKEIESARQAGRQ